MKNKLVLAGAFLGGLIVVLVWMQGGFHSKVSGGRSSLSNKDGPVPRKTLKIEPTRSTGEVTVPGSVVFRETATVAARGQGYVIEIMADAGDRVKKGASLLSLDNKEVGEREAQAKAALESVKADLVKARMDFERYEKLYEKQSIAKKEFDAAKAGHYMALAAEQKAQAALDEAKTMLSHGVVTAPFDGIVAERSVNQGDLVSPGRILFSIFSPASAELVAQAGEQYIPVLKEGTAVSVKIPSVGLQEKATIREVVPRGDEKSRTITVKAPLPEAPGIAPNIFGTMTFETATTMVISIPRKAVKVVGQLETVRVREQGSVKVRHVKTGRAQGDNIEVLSGLKAGEELVLE